MFSRLQRYALLDVCTRKAERRQRTGVPSRMRRRDFIASLASTVAWLRATRAMGHRLMRLASDISSNALTLPTADGSTRHKDQNFGGNVQRRNVGCLRRFQCE